MSSTHSRISFQKIDSTKLISQITCIVIVALGKFSDYTLSITIPKNITQEPVNINSLAVSQNSNHSSVINPAVTSYFSEMYIRINSSDHSYHDFSAIFQQPSVCRTALTVSRNIAIKTFPDLEKKYFEVIDLCDQKTMIHIRKISSRIVVFKNLLISVTAKCDSKIFQSNRISVIFTNLSSRAYIELVTGSEVQRSMSPHSALNHHPNLNINERVFQIRSQLTLALVVPAQEQVSANEIIRAIMIGSNKYVSYLVDMSFVDICSA